MPRSYFLRLDDMLRAIEQIHDRPSQMIVERGFEIVSEASRHLPDEVKQRHPEIPWKKIANIGNVLHDSL